MASTVVPWVTSIGTVPPGADARPAPGRSCGATCRSRSTKDDPGSSPGPKVGSGDSITRRAYTGPFSGPAGRSVVVGTPMTLRTPVGIVDDTRHRVCPPTVPGGDAVRSVDAHVPRWSGADPTTLVPGVERTRGAAELGEGAVRIEEVVDAVGLGATEVLAPELQPGVARETPGTVAEPRRVTRLAFVVGVVEDGA